MSKYDALYHLKKIAGYYKEIEKHMSELEKLGIEVMPIDSSDRIYVKSGIEKFRVPLEEGKVKSFSHLGVEVCQ